MPPELYTEQQMADVFPSPFFLARTPVGHAASDQSDREGSTSVFSFAWVCSFAAGPTQYWSGQLITHFAEDDVTADETVLL